jgi:hypothetical protein
MAETRFEGSSPVARYWLTRCEGFAVRGSRSGVVESLIREADPHETAWLVVRTRGRRRRTVPVGAVAMVDPAERVVVLGEQREPRVGPAVRAATAAGGRTAARSAQHVRLAGGTAARAVAPRARTGAQGARSAAAATAQAVGPLARTTGRRVRLAAAAAAAHVIAAGRLVVATLAHSFRSLAAEARYPKPYVPAKRSASSRTSSDAGSPTTFR